MPLAKTRPAGLGAPRHADILAAAPRRRARARLTSPGAGTVIFVPSPPDPSPGGAAVLVRACAPVLVVAGTVAVLAIALLAVVALLLGAVELGAALHEATHQAPTIAGRAY